MICVYFSNVAREFPGVPLETLRKRYRRMKAKTKEWTEYAVCTMGLTGTNFRILC